MMRNIIVLLLIATPLQAQRVKIQLDDQSEVRGVLINKSITINTIYGDLTVPVEDVRHIRFALHNTLEDDKAIASATKRLGSSVFKERKTAYHELITFGRKALPVLTTHTDPEVSKAFKEIKSSILDKTIRAVYTSDLIKTKYFDINGYIKDSHLDLKSSILGDVKLKLSDIDTLTSLHYTQSVVKIEATDIWWPTGIFINAANKIIFTATGNVDLYPQTPNQYVVGPKGYTTAGRGGQYMAGALVGKIKDTFLIGEGTTVQTNQTGELFLHIIQSPWNNKSDGMYEVTIKVGE